MKSPIKYNGVAANRTLSSAYRAAKMFQKKKLKLSTKKRVRKNCHEIGGKLFPFCDGNLKISPWAQYRAAAIGSCLLIIIFWIFFWGEGVPFLGRCKFLVGQGPLATCPVGGGPFVFFRARSAARDPVRKSVPRHARWRQIYTGRRTVPWRHLARN